MKERPNWKEFDPSTFTHIARNDVSVNWVSEYRHAHGLPSISRVVLLGSGPVEPFTIAALPKLKEAEIYAVDLNDDIVSMVHDIKDGRKIKWEDVAGVSYNPGVPNIDFIEEERVRNGLLVLKNLGSLGNLGSEFDQRGIKVSEEVSSRVNIVKGDALGYLRNLETEPDLIADFFMQVNINKNEEIGLSYTNDLVSQSLELLNEDGFYLVGDTGQNLGKTIGHFSRLSTRGRLGLVSFVHSVNFGSGYASSHYLLASKLEKMPGEETLKQKARQAIGSSRALSELSVSEEDVKPSRLEEQVRSELNLAYVGEVSWSSEGIESSLEKLVPEDWDEFSTEVVLPPQKPFLDN